VPALVSVLHFLTKLFLAAPASFFSAAWASQAADAVVAPASLSHFFRKLVLAAPASFFSVALASQLASTASADVDSPTMASVKAMKIFFMNDFSVLRLRGESPA